MTNQLLQTPHPVPLDQPLQKYLNSSNFLPNNIWKIVFSPCTHYLAIPKQDIYGNDSIIIIYCPNWYANNPSDELYVHKELICSSSIWSLAFGQYNLNEENISLKQNHSNLSVNRRYDLTKNLFLAAGRADGKINIWNIDTGELTLILTDHKSTVCGLSFTLNSMQLASCSHDTTIKLWDLLDDGNMYKTINKWTHVINAVKYSPNEKLLCAVGPHEFVILYDTITWKEIFKYNGHENSVIDCDFSSDSALLATASYDTRVLLWSTITGELLKEFYHLIPRPLRIYAGGDNGSFVRSVAFTKYNHFIITTCDDNNVRWFSVESSYRKEAVYSRKQNNVLSMALASDGKIMAVGTRTGQVHAWSTLMTSSICKPPLLKSLCRIKINSHFGIEGKPMIDLTIPKHLINYLLYKDIKAK